MLKHHVYGLPIGQISAIVLFSAISPAVLLMAPAIAAQLAAERGLGTTEIGHYFFCELAAMSLAAFPALYWRSRVDWRKVAFCAIGIFILANGASIIATDYSTLLLSRVFSALGGGTLMVLSMTSAASSPDRERVYGLWVCGQLILGAIGLEFLPILFSHFGLRALFCLLALMMAILSPLACHFSSGYITTVESLSDIKGRSGAVRQTLGLLAVFSFYISLSGVWTFISRPAEVSGLDATTIGTILSIATLFGIPGAISATVIGQRWPQRVLLLSGYSAMTFSLFLLAGVSGALQFAAAVIIFKFSWTFLLPYILASLAQLDPNGRLMGTVNLVIGMGLALGPVAAGAALDGTLGFQGLIVISASITASSYILLILANRTAEKSNPS